MIRWSTKIGLSWSISPFFPPWHCSQDVSRLFASINFEETPEEEDKYFNRLPYYASEYKGIKEDKYYRSAGFAFTPGENLYEDLDDLNELIYKS